jgi:hypothetical protein
MPDQPENTSPDTLDDDIPTVGDIADAVLDRIKGLFPGPADSAPAADEPPAGAPTEPAPAQAPSAPSPAGESVADTVRRVLLEKDTDARIAAVESKVGEPAAPKPDRTGIAAAIFGKTRT